MIISNLSHMETVSRETAIEGGSTRAIAVATAKAFGRNFARAITRTFTLTRSNRHGSIAIAKSFSFSSSR